jgi:hypothetical protein
MLVKASFQSFLIGDRRAHHVPMARYSPYYRRPPGKEPLYALAEARMLVAERDYQFSLYAVDVVVSNGTTGRHVFAVPVAISAVSIMVGVLLTEEESLIIDAGDIGVIASLANAVQGSYQRFRTFPANDLSRFVLSKLHPVLAVLIWALSG